MKWEAGINTPAAGGKEFARLQHRLRHILQNFRNNNAELYCTFFLRWPRQGTISLEPQLRFVLCCMNFARERYCLEMSAILWHCASNGGTWQWLHAISGMSRTSDPTFSRLFDKRSQCFCRQLLFSHFFCFFDNSVSHSASTRWDDFLNAFPLWARRTGPSRLHIGGENEKAAQQIHYTATAADLL